MIKDDTDRLHEILKKRIVIIVVLVLRHNGLELLISGQLESRWNVTYHMVTRIWAF